MIAWPRAKALADLSALIAAGYARAYLEEQGRDSRWTLRYGGTPEGVASFLERCEIRGSLRVRSPLWPSGVTSVTALELRGTRAASG